MTFCTGMYHQSVSSNMKKNLHKINDFIDNDVILLGHVCRLSEDTQKKNEKYSLLPYYSIEPISHLIIHQSMLYEPLSNLIGSLSLYYDFILH